MYKYGKHYPGILIGTDACKLITVEVSFFSSVDNIPVSRLISVQIVIPLVSSSGIINIPSG